MAVLRKIVLVLVVLVALLAGIGMLLPRHSHVERRIAIDAPRATVYALLDGYRQFDKWSPWAALDPNAKYVFEGPAFGVGAKEIWSGDPKTVGSGSQEIVEVKPPESVTSRLDFGAQGIATARFDLAADDNRTRVTWSMETDNGAGPVGRWFGLMMDRFIGPDFEKGLAGLKKFAESLPKADFADLKVATGDVVPVTVACVDARDASDAKDIGDAIGAAYAKILAFMKANGLKQAGPPLTIDMRVDGEAYAFEAAIPVDRAPEKAIPADSPVKVKSTYGGKVLKVVVKGPYGPMQGTYAKLQAYMAARGYEPAGAPWNAYVSFPGTTPDAELITNIFQPVK